jgi:CobQ-like glutamine amidotransferase family enzyme
MELNICHLYPDLLNVYGDLGNIRILKYRAEKRGIKVNVFNVSMGDTFKGELYDIVFFGGGQDYEQSIVSSDLKETKKYAISEYIEKGVSGFKVRANEREKLEELKEDALANKFDVVLVFMFD